MGMLMPTNKIYPLFLSCEHQIRTNRTFSFLAAITTNPATLSTVYRSDCSQENIICDRKCCTCNKMLVVLSVELNTPHFKREKTPKILTPCCWLKPAPQKQRIQVIMRAALEAYAKNRACIPHVLHHRDSHSRR